MKNFNLQLLWMAMSGLCQSSIARLRFLAAMQSALGVPHDATVYCGVGASSTIHDLHPKLADELDNSFNEIEFKLNYNHYPTSKSLVKNANRQCREGMLKIATATNISLYPFLF